MSRLERYPSYKDSGVEWIGKIPKHWEISKLGTSLKPISIKNRADLPLLSVTREQGVILRDIDDKESNHNFIPDDLSSYKMVKKGQFAMNKMKAWQGSYGISDYTGIVSPAYFIFELNGIEPTFFHKAIRSSVYVPFFIKASDGVRIGQWDLSKSRMKEIPFYIPPKEEQTKIASFLNEKTAQIDELISQKEKLIELLKERKQIVINDAVTKGLDKNVEFVDSGVEWIGKIPKHWEVKKLKYSVKNKTIKSTENSFKIALENIESQTTKYIETKDIVFSEAGINFNKGDVLFGKLRPYLAKVYLAEKNGLCVSEFLVLEAKKINNIFLKFLLVSDLFIRHVNSSTYGTKMPRASWDFIGNSLIPIPPKSEQLQIVEYIETQTTKIDKAIELQQNYISKLGEYKATLIDSVVTGKARVA